MKLNERGSSLVQVLLAIIVFSVLGFALMGNVINENKRTNTTESNMQVRYLAESGLTYFESDFKSYIENNPYLSVDFTDFPEYLNDNFLGKYFNEGKVVQDDPEKIIVMAEWVDKLGNKVADPSIADINTLRIKVISTGKINSNEETLVGYYKPGVDIDRYTVDFPEFPADGLAVDFAKKNVLGLELLSLLNVEVIGTKGDDKTFYVVPSHSLIGVSALADLISVDLLEINRFKMMEENSVIATRQGRLVGVDLGLDLNNFSGMRTRKLTINVDVLKLRDSYDTNVLIDGSYDTGIKILGIDLTEKRYKDINFKKLAVLGNVIIKQDRVADGSKNHDTANPRAFTFQDGLFVNKSLVIGGHETELDDNQEYMGKSNLMLGGNMLIMEDLYISDVDVLFDVGDDSLPPHEKYSNLYVYGDVTIKDTACIKKGNLVRIFSKGKITIENNGGYSEQCNEYNGLFYAENGIEIDTLGKKMKIRGRLIGDVTVINDQIGNLEYPNVPPQDIYQIILGNTKLIPKGRTFN